MRRLLLLGWLTCVGLWAQAPSGSLAVVSAASYGPLIAPDSLATVFGNNLALTAQAQLDAQGQLPTSLGGVRVELNGVAMPLLFTSPLQINFYVPPDVAVGGATVVVRTGAGSVIAQGQADVRTIAPALFSVDSSGRGTAIAQNAVTYAGAPFLVETPEIAGDDRRTRVVLYGTGFRAASTTRDGIRALGRLTSGATVDIPVEFPVEYAGPTPGFFGLDQLNLVLPAEIDGAGVVGVTLFQGALTSNEVSFTVGSLPPDAIQVAAVVLNATSVIGGQALTGTVSLNAPARLNGFVVTLRSDSNNVQVPVSVNVPVGQVTARIDVRTTPVAASRSAHVIASTGTATRSAALRVDPSNTPVVADLRLSSTQVTGGGGLTGTVVLSAAAPATGAVVSLQSNGSAAVIPPSVTVLGGQTTATFPITTVVVPTPVTINFTASVGDSSRTVTLAIAPALLVTFANATAVGGNTVTGAIALGQAAPAGGAAVTLRSNNLAAQVPGIVTIGAQQSTATFTFRTTAVTQTQSVTVTASYNGQESAATLTLTPAGSTSLTGVTVSPNVLKGGQSATGQVTLAGPAPAGGVIVSLQTSSLSAQIPPSVTINSGQTAATFAIRTSLVAQPVTATITATALGQNQTATLTISP